MSSTYAFQMRSPRESESRRQGAIALACYGAELDVLFLMVRPRDGVVKRTAAKTRVQTTG
ncbi:MAG TPA: hypothetical protein VGD59_05115 [Acidisarcina sp.]